MQAEISPVLSAEESQASATTYYPFFDYLRITLAVGVFLAHAELDLNIGNFCVQVFFALSGFLIGSILCQSNRKDIPRFYFNRCTRIWIPYFIGILLMITAGIIKGEVFTQKITELYFYKATFVYNFFGPPQLALKHLFPLQGTGNGYWSVCVEEQFYLMAPFILVLAKKYAAPLMGVLALLLCYKYSGYFASISLGVFFALSKIRHPQWHLKFRAKALFIAAMSILALAAYFNILSYEAYSPFMSVLVVMLLCFEGTQQQLGKTLGGMSYPFYLNHWVGLFFTKRIIALTNSHSFAIVLALLISLGFSWAHYQIIDKNIVIYRKKVSSPHVYYACSFLGFTLVTIGFVVTYFKYS
jgi:peptidoglycan/LPS O-acetylase OafA/YrhL